MTVVVSHRVAIDDVGLILRSGLLAASRRMATHAVSWFETREDALLTMRNSPSPLP